MEIFVINLLRSVDRRAAMLLRLEQLGLTPTFFEAKEGAKLDRSTIQSRPAAQRLSDGEFGCYLSHVAVWQKIVDERINLALVLEDDILLSADVPRILAELVAGPAWRYDMIRLSALQPIRGWELERLASGQKLVLARKNLSGAQGYLLSKTGAARFIDAIAKPNRPIDDEIDHFWRHHLRVAAISPSVIRHEPTSASTIGARGWDQARFSSPVERVKYSFMRKMSLAKIWLDIKKSK